MSVVTILSRIACLLLWWGTGWSLHELCEYGTGAKVLGIPAVASAVLFGIAFVCGIIIRYHLVLSGF